MAENDTYKEKYFEEKFKGIQSTANAHFVAVNKSLTNIENHLAKQNGTIAEMKKVQDNGLKVIDEFHEFKGRFGALRRKWIWFVIGGVLFVSIIHFLYDVGAITELLMKLASTR